MGSSIDAGGFLERFDCLFCAFWRWFSQSASQWKSAILRLLEGAAAQAATT